MNFKNKFQNVGVSPTIGVILMVAVTVALVSLVAVIAFDIGGETSESPDATVQFANDNGQVKATVLRNSNVDTLRLQYEDGTTKTIGSTSGTTATMEEGDGQYQVIAVMDDGSEQVLQSKEFESVNTGTTLSGTVSINPPISGATVEALDSDGNVLATDTTDSNGKYSFSKEGIDSVRVVVNGFNAPELSNPVYGTKIEEKTSSTIDLDFGNFYTSVTSDIDGDESDEQVRYSYSNGNLLIGNVYQLQSIENQDLSADYKLIRDIDASGTDIWNNGSGFDPIGDSSTNFKGNFNGNEYKIDGLYIDRESSNNIGLFASTNSDTKIKNVGLTNSHISGSNTVGSFVGENSGTIKNSYATGSVSGGLNVGGLVGLSYTDSTVTESYATVSVSGGSYDVGGLVGTLSNATIKNSYATGSVTSVGGLVGYSTGTVLDSYWDTESTGLSSSAGGTGLTTSEMQGSSAKDNMNGFDFSSTWNTVSGDYPELSWQD